MDEIANNTLKYLSKDNFLYLRPDFRSVEVENPYTKEGYFEFIVEDKYNFNMYI